METTNKRNNIIIAAVVLIVIAIIVGAYKFDNRFDEAEPTDTVATSTLNLATTTESIASTSPVVGSSPQPAPNLKLGEGYIKLESEALTPKSNISNWTTYTNSDFSLKYPPTAQVRKFVGGANDEYGIALTLSEPGGRFAEKYFELTTEKGDTTACDALLDSNSSRISTVGKVSFITREYNDGTSHVVEYTSKVGKICYHAFSRLNSPSTGGASSPAGDATTRSEGQLLQDIMATFKLK